MNILRYKWSAVLAAGLHGALFINLPHHRIVTDPIPIAEPLPPIPTDLIRIEVPEPADTPSIEPAAAIPDRPVTPEPPPMPSVAPQIFTTPIHEASALRPINGVRIIGPEGMDGKIDGTGLKPGAISLPRDLDRIPRATSQISPDYPSSLRTTGETGSVLVEFDVDTSGRVVRAEAVRFSRREFVDPAVRAVLKWRFESGKRNGKIVPFRMAVPIEFSGLEK